MRTVAHKSRKVYFCSSLAIFALLLVPSRSLAQKCYANGGDVPLEVPCPKSSPKVIIVTGPWFDRDPFPQVRHPPNPEKELSEMGPQFPMLYSMSDLSFYAFVKGNWPLVIDYEPLQTSLIIFTIDAEADGIGTFSYRLDGTKPGRQQVLLRIPARFGDKPRIAEYSMSAFAPGLGEQKPATFRIYGFAAGDRAVGSMGIDQLRFEPGSVSPKQKQKAFYNFHSLFDFSKVAAEFMLVGLDASTREIKAKLVKSEEIGGGVHRDAWISKQWNGKNDKGNVSQGQHQLHVRAWRGVDSGGDWVAAWSPQLVHISE